MYYVVQYENSLIKTADLGPIQRKYIENLQGKRLTSMYSFADRARKMVAVFQHPIQQILVFNPHFNIKQLN